MSSLRDLKGKTLEIELKRGATLEYFAQKYECTQDEFLEYLEKNFCEKAKNSIVRNMTKNAKKRKPTKRVQGKGPKLTLSQIHESSRPILQEDKQVNNSTTEDSELQKLKERETLLISEISKQEMLHEKSISERMKLFEELRQQREKMLELKEIIKQNQKEVEKISTELVEITERIAAENKTISTNKQTLEEVKICIKSFEKIIIFVYKNGETEIDNEADIPETTGWDEVFDGLIHNKALEELSLKQVQQFAKLLVLVEKLQAKNRKYELTFESKDDQIIFENL